MARTVESRAPEVVVLCDLLAEAFDRKAWHGPGLRGTLRGLGPAAASWRPGPGRHNVRELVVHAAYWKYAVRRNLTGERRGSFPLAGSNWFPRPAEGAADPAREWKGDVALLVAEHRRLLAAVSAIDLASLPAARRKRVLFLVRGAAAHDLYHAGQVSLLKRLAPAGLA